MAEIQSNSRAHNTLRLDMTPMVDLAFLLLTFFVLAATLSKPKVREIIYPEADGPPTPLNERDAITLLLGEDEEHIAWFSGIWREGSTVLNFTSLSAKGIRQVLFTEKEEALFNVDEWKKVRESGDLSEVEFEALAADRRIHKSRIMFIIKTLPETPFRFVISAMDEAEISKISRRVVQGMNPSEAELLRKGGASGV